MPMDASLISAIGSLGFPIVACIAMAWYINNTLKSFNETMQKNTVALEKLISKIGGMD